MADFLLEIGTEEVPAAAVVPALEQLATLTRDLLAKERIAAGEVRTLGTPRRLVVYVKDVAARQEDAVLQQRGPAKGAAFDAAGAPTKAAEGFARRYGLTPDQLQIRATDSGEYVFAEQKVEGKATPEVLGSAFPQLLADLRFPKFMRWGDGKHRFSRPIRWLCALVGEEIVPLEVAGIQAGRATHGHRFLTIDGTDQQSIELARAENYFAAVASLRVVVDPAARLETVRAQGDALASTEGIRVVWDEELLREVTYVVEYPTAFVGKFDEQFLSLPRPVLVSAMRKHQRYFTLEMPDGSLAPRFLAVRNGGEYGLDTVREGNERVLAFRFNDAVHHHNEDLKTTLLQKRERLRRIVFMEKLGTVHDRAERLEAMVGTLCDAAGLSALKAKAQQAAHLSKADLASAMVAELPELQGVIGREYGLREGLDADVASAIAEHYQPKGAGEPLPPSDLGKLLALADRLDLLVAAFSLGHVPTGSSDPFGLRRAAAGVVALTTALPASLELTALLEACLQTYAGAEYYANASPRPAEEVVKELVRFLRPRVESLLEEAGTRADLIEAVLGAGMESVPSILERARFLQGKTGDAAWDAVVAVGTRLRNILKPVDGQELPADFARLERPSELKLVQEAEKIEAAAAQGREALWNAWAAAAPSVEQFFVDVLVNVEEVALRDARRALLRRLDRTFLTLADFSRIAAL